MSMPHSGIENYVQILEDKIKELEQAVQERDRMIENMVNSVIEFTKTLGKNQALLLKARTKVADPKSES